MSIAKHLVILVVVFALLFSSLRISFTYMYYYLDPAGFTEKLCENQDKPELECNGKCYLKKIVSSEDQGSNSTLPEIEYKDFQLFLEAASRTEFLLVNSELVPVDMYDNRYEFLFESRLFHPPKIVM